MKSLAKFTARKQNEMQYFGIDTTSPRFLTGKISPSARNSLGFRFTGENRAIALDISDHNL